MNCYITTKIAFANMIGDLAIKVGAEPEKILAAIGSDSRIGNKYFKYGYGFGGPCFPRDNKAFGIFASDSGLPSLISKGFVYKWQKDADKALIDRAHKYLSEKQKNELENVLKETNDINKFLKTIKGRLTKEQSAKLKEIIEIRNAEIKDQNLAPVENLILHKTFSFAPFMFLGVIITLLTSSNLIHLF